MTKRWIVKEVFGKKVIVDEEEESKRNGEALALVLPIVQNLLITYVVLGGEIQNLDIDKALVLITSDWLAFIITFLSITILLALTFSFTPGVIPHLFPILIGIGVAVSIYQWIGRDLTGFNKVFSVGIALFVGLLMILTNISLEKFGNWIRWRCKKLFR